MLSYHVDGGEDSILYRSINEAMCTNDEVRSWTVSSGGYKTERFVFISQVEKLCIWQRSTRFSWEDWSSEKKNYYPAFSCTNEVNTAAQCLSNRAFGVAEFHSVVYSWNAGVTLMPDFVTVYSVSIMRRLEYMSPIKYWTTIYSVSRAIYRFGGGDWRRRRRLMERELIV